MNIKTLIKTAFLMMLLFTLSCKKNDVSTTDTKENQFAREAVEDDGNSDDEVVLGDKLENPYLVANMQKAVDELASAGIKSSCPFTVRATHYYVKFKPKDMDEYEKLDNDDRIETSEEVPIDRQVLIDGGNYHDPSLPDSVPTYQYCAVKINYPFDLEVGYEIIAELYIPEEDDMLSCNEDNEDYIDKLLDQAYTQTGNFDDVVGNALARGRCGRYSPRGRIEVNDTRLNTNIGLQGIRVKARRWFTTRIMLTDFNGNYSTNKTFKRPCNYSLKFGRPNFCVRKHFIPGTYRIGGPKKCGDWNTVLASGYQRFAGHIFRSAETSFYRDIDGLTRPYRYGGKRQVYIGRDTHIERWTGINWIVLPIIQIARYRDADKRNEYSSDEVYGVTIHESTHTSHALNVMNAGVIQFWQVDKQIVESWATGVQWYLTRKEYVSRGIINYGRFDYAPGGQLSRPHFVGYQYWNLDVDSDYTNLFINLEDGYNESLFYSSSKSPDDEIFGYTIPFVEQNILKHAYGKSSLRDEMKAHRPNTTITDAQIDRLISFY